ncbi:MAG: nickel ABC transporter permease subunit NikB, partial [Staphylococcus lugdunensis]|nr:nickel ABC transporter permease subunit NikB [Staphylococcus lugdunensis]
MVKFIIKRIALMVPLMLVVSFLTFLLTYLTDENPAVTILHAQGVPHVTPQLIAETKAKYGLDQPLLIQYKNWLIQALQLNFGTSYITGDPVASRIT